MACLFGVEVDDGFMMWKESIVGIMDVNDYVLHDKKSNKPSMRIS